MRDLLSLPWSGDTKIVCFCKKIFEALSVIDLTYCNIVKIQKNARNKQKTSKSKTISKQTKQKNKPLLKKQTNKQMQQAEMISEICVRI